MGVHEGKVGCSMPPDGVSSMQMLGACAQRGAANDDRTMSRTPTEGKTNTGLVCKQARLYDEDALG